VDPHQPWGIEHASIQEETLTPRPTTRLAAHRKWNSAGRIIDQIFQILLWFFVDAQLGAAALESPEDAAASRF